MVKLGFLERENIAKVSLPITGANNAGMNGFPETVEVNGTAENVLKQDDGLRSRGADIKNEQRPISSSKIVEGSCHTCYYYDMQRDLDSNNAFVTEKEIEYLKLCPSLFNLNPQNVIKIEICLVRFSISCPYISNLISFSSEPFIYCILL